jgi:hypothetical protein
VKRDGSQPREIRSIRAHRRDGGLVTLGGHDDPKLPARGHHNGAAAFRGPVDSRDECCGSGRGRADAYLAGIPSHTDVADIDVVAAARQVEARLISCRDVEGSGRVGIKRIDSGGGVVIAQGVGIERVVSVGGVIAARANADRSRSASNLFLLGDYKVRHCEPQSMKLGGLFQRSNCNLLSAPCIYTCVAVATSSHH